jgi:hypothetical protein
VFRYYHAIARYEDKGKIKVYRDYNLSEDEVKKEIVNPFNEKKSLMIMDKFIPSSSITQLIIFGDPKGVDTSDNKKYKGKFIMHLSFTQAIALIYR